MAYKESSAVSTGITNTLMKACLSWEVNVSNTQVSVPFGSNMSLYGNIIASSFYHSMGHHENGTNYNHAAEWFSVNGGAGYPSYWWVAKNYNSSATWNRKSTAYTTYVYSYVERAGNSAIVYSDAITIPALPTPSAPTSCTHTRDSDNQNSISWALAGSNPRSNHLIERSVDGGGYSQIASISGSATSYVDSTTQPDHFYSYRVRAVFTANGYTMRSGYSNESTPTYNSPTAPSELTVARASETTVKGTMKNTSIVSTGLEYQRSADGVTFSESISVSGQALTEFTDTPGGGTWYYRARNTRGSLVSPWSNVSEKVVTIIAPAPPTLNSPLNGSVIDRSTPLTRLAFTHNPKDGSAQTSAQVRYSVDNGGSWTTQTITSNAAYLDIATSVWAVNAKVLWQVRTKGAHADYGDWSSSNSFTVCQVPQAAITSPASDTTEIDRLPIEIAWTYSDQSGSQMSAALKLFMGEQLVWSKTLTGTQTSYLLTASDLVPDNGMTYTIELTVTSTSTLTAKTVRGFTTDYLEPILPVGTAVIDESRASVSLLVEGGTQDWKETAEGNPVVVEGAEYPLQGLSFDGNYSQDGTPAPDTPAPISVITEATVRACGKNLIDWSSLVRAYHATPSAEKGSLTLECTGGWSQASYSIRVAPGVAYSVSCLISNPFENRTCLEVRDGKTIADAILFGSAQTTEVNREVQGSFTPTTDYICLTLIGNNTSTPVSNVSVTFAECQLELGSEATDYEPPTGYNEVALDFTMPNLAEGVAIEQGTLSQGTGVAAASNIRVRTATSIVLQAGFYTIDSVGLCMRGLYKWQLDGTYIGYTPIGTGTYKYSFTLAEATQVKIIFGTVPADQNCTPADLTSWSLVQGLEQQQWFASLPDGTRDEYDAATRTLTSKVGKAVIDGSSYAAGYTALNGGVRYFIVTLRQPAASPNPAEKTLCDTLTPKVAAQAGIVYVIGSGVYLYLNDQSITTLAEANAWFAANPTTVYYELATPYTIQLPTPDLPTLTEGTNTLMLLSDPEPQEVSWEYPTELPRPNAVAYSIIRRHADGRQVSLATMQPSGTSVDDPYCPVGQEITYIFVAHAETGAVSRLEVPVRIRGELGCWINFGEKVCAVLLDTSISDDTSHNAEYFQTAGSADPIVCYGDDIDYSGTITGTLVRDKSIVGRDWPVEIDDFRALSRHIGTVVIRRPYEDAFPAAISVSQSADKRQIGSVSIPWKRVRDDDLTTL